MRPGPPFPPPRVHAGAATALAYNLVNAAGEAWPGKGETPAVYPGGVGAKLNPAQVADQEAAKAAGYEERRAGARQRNAGEPTDGRWVSGGRMGLGGHEWGAGCVGDGWEEGRCVPPRQCSPCSPRPTK